MSEWLTQLYRKIPVIRELHEIKMRLRNDWYRHKLTMMAASVQTIEAIKAGNERYRDSKRLLVHGAQYWSQNLEDGMIAEIFRRIGTVGKTFLEIGSGDGRENNTTALLSAGWSGWWIDGNAEACASANAQLQKMPETAKRLKVEQAMVSPDNVKGVLAKMGVPQEVDLFSLDIDLNTYHIWAALTEFRPRAVVVEYNGAFPPEQAWIHPLRADNYWDYTQPSAASLKAFELLGARFGYSLVGCDITGINAFFVRNNLVGDLFAQPYTAENHHEPPRYYLIYRMTHPQKFFVESAPPGEFCAPISTEPSKFPSGMILKDVISRQRARLQHLWMGRPERVIYFGQGIGDDLLCTTVARELKKRGADRIVMLSRHPSLFANNGDVDAVYPFGYATAGRLRRWGYRCHVPQYSAYEPETDREIYPTEHLLAAMCRMSGVTGVIELRPYLTLLEGEKSAGRLFENQAVIQSSGRPAGPDAITNKDWFPERYQEVSDQLGDGLKMIQLGQVTDPPLRGALDLRGKTTLREAAAILAASRIFIGQVGFLMHLARAVETRAVIVYGGRELPAITGYRANENIVGRTLCSPCWQRTRCDYGHECMRMIEVGAVVAAARRQLERAGTPLEVESADLDASPRAAS